MKNRVFTFCLIILTLYLSTARLIRLVIFYVTPDVLSKIYYQKRLDGKVILDRNNVPICFIPNKLGEFQVNTNIKRLPTYLINALLSAEGKRFFSHIGVDFLAIIRAFIQNLINMKRVSGASTITQQVVRILFPAPRTLTNKIKEALYAIKLEMQSNKEEILNLWLNYAPMFGNYRGIEIASRVLFNKTSNSLSLVESILLISLPKSPTSLNPLKSNNNLLKNRMRFVLDRMYKNKYLSYTEFYEAISEKNFKKLHLKKIALPRKAPHFVNIVKNIL